MLVGLETFDLRIPGCGSLKEKRHVVKTLTARIRQKFNVSVAEVDHQDLWQRSTIAVSAVAGDAFHARRVPAGGGKVGARSGGAGAPRPRRARYQSGGWLC